MTIDNTYFHSLIAAFLHDIGKTYHRFNKHYGLNHESKGFSLLNEKGGEVLNEAKKYLNPGEDNLTNDIFTLIKLADHLSAGEREPYQEKPKNKKENLLNIFSLICRTEKNYFSNIRFSDALKNNVILTEDTFKIDEIERDLKKVGITIDELYKNKENPLDYFKMLNLLSAYVREYNYYLPSAFYYDTPTIDLFIHAKTTAALFSVLYKLRYYYNEEAHLNKVNTFVNFLFENLKSEDNKLEDSDKKVLNLFRTFPDKEDLKKHKIMLITGDFSGIQDFISIVHSDKALRMFKARSSYISLLNKLIPLKIVEALRLSPFNIISSGGGRFEILSDFTPESVKIVKEIADIINRDLYHKFGGTLFLEVKSLTFPLITLNRAFYRAIYYNPRSDIDKDAYLEEIKEELNLKNNKKLISSEGKRTKFKFLFEQKIPKGSKFSDGFENEVDGKTECKVCHALIQNLNSDDDPGLCKTCNELLDLRDFLVSVEVKKERKDYYYPNSLKSIYKDLFVFNKDKPNEINLNPYLDESLKLYEIAKDISFVNRLSPNQFIFDLGVVGYPLKSTKEGQHLVKSFDDLVKVGKNNYLKLGALKIDVDNLGRVLTNKICDENKGEINNKIYITSLSKFQRLSYDLRVFFEGLLGEKLFNKQGNIYIIYSGGDDTLIVGRWYDVLRMAQRINNEFKIFVGKNEKLTLSASFYRFDHNFPISRVYEICEELLEEAKNNKSFGVKKQRISIDGLNLIWDYTNKELFNTSDKEEISTLIKELTEDKNQTNQFERFINLTNLFVNLLDKKIVGTSLLERFLLINTEIFTSLLNGKLKLKVHLFKYNLERNLSKNQEEIKDLLWELLKEYYYSLLMSDEKQDILGYAIKYALWYYKDKKYEEEKKEDEENELSV